LGRGKQRKRKRKREREEDKRERENEEKGNVPTSLSALAPFVSCIYVACWVRCGCGVLCCVCVVFVCCGVFVRVYNICCQRVALLLRWMAVVGDKNMQRQ